MISDSSPRGPRSTARTQERLTRKRRWTRRNSPPASSDLELVDATHRGLEASFVGDEPDIVAVRLGELDLGPAQQDHALAAHAHDPRRQARHRLGPLALERLAVLGSEDRERADRLVGEKHRAQGDPAGLAAELGHDLRRADPVVVELRLLDRVTGEAPEVHARLPADRGVQRRHPRGHAEEEACSLVGDDDFAARVQGGQALSRLRARLGEGRGQLGAAVVGTLAQDRARAARPPSTSHVAAWTGRFARQVETSRTATGSRVTASRTATPAQTHS